jgi:hypothetical protein
MKRILKIVVGLVVVAVVALVIFAFFGLGRAIKVAVESVGSSATGTQVTLKSADVSLTTGEGRLTGLVVGNPKGYGTPSALELGDIDVKIDTSTVTSDTIVIEKVVIENPGVTYEVGPGGSNIGVIQANVDAFSKSLGAGGSSGGGGGESKPKSAPAPKTDDKSGGKKFVITDLIVRGGNVNVSASVLGGKKVTATMKEIHLQNLGKAEGGATTGEIAEKVLAAITSGTLSSVRDLGIGALNDSLKGVEQAGGSLLKKVFGK